GNDSTRFEESLPDIDANTGFIFSKVADRLNDFYRITNFAEDNKEVVCALVRLCLLQEPAKRDFRPCEKFPTVTLELLERDTHTIFEDSGGNDGTVLVRNPFFFLHLYNKAIEQVRSGLPKTLSVVTSVHRFPETGGLMVRDQEQEQERDWKSGIVFKNAAGANFGDVCVYRKGSTGNSNGILCALQAKKQRSSLSVKSLQKEHTKNTDTIAVIPTGGVADRQGIKKMRLITVLITTEGMTDAAFKQVNDSFPADCLLIYQDNFISFFGEALGVPLALAYTKDHNLNFATRETLKSKHKLGDLEVNQVLENMPYRSYEDLVRKVPVMGDKDLDKEMGWFLPYQDFQTVKRRRVE
ncbi:hypothetical protein BGZ83_003027, partial [Gryganskiella cystojenkinii]